MHFGNSTALPIGPKKLSQLVMFSLLCLLQNPMETGPLLKPGSCHQKNLHIWVSRRGDQWITETDEVMRIRSAVKRLQNPLGLKFKPINLTIVETQVSDTRRSDFFATQETELENRNNGEKGGPRTVIRNGALRKQCNISWVKVSGYRPEPRISDTVASSDSDASKNETDVTRAGKTGY
ncbi:hypothetical protein B0H17DRAFT_1128495 [Mycena rosella]|uniref:Uncharacterized protein n=1 Tax=Mycena rosella TaxID=1033263 RepID=A0AAD7DXC3_MYCRO|nr:hypothetical protein B0H17DRAFT_1128495 [Mycena rosella]